MRALWIIASVGIACAARAEDKAGDKTYTLEQNVPTEVAVGKSATATIAFVPKSTAYHINCKEYPTKLKLTAPAEVTLPKAEQKGGDAKTFTETRAEFEVPFTATKAGAYEINVDLKAA